MKMANNISLSTLHAGEKGTVVSILQDSRLRRRFFDLGIIPGTVIECIQQSALGDPTAYLIREAVIAIRSEDADCIQVDLV
ncbi:FeoA domain protein [Treponema phagedenis F0421]|nr:FeoA domain protein [Treponema phagedenis F0421]TYT78101.1 ferrous iron transport protein A [Treponema phagedenis]